MSDSTPPTKARRSHPKPRKPGRVVKRKAPLKDQPERIRYRAMYWRGNVEMYAGTFDTYEAAEEAWIQVSGAHARGEVGPVKSKIRFDDFINTVWRPRYVPKRTRTKDNIDSTVKADLIPAFGSHSLAELMDGGLIASWRAELEDEDFEQSTIRTKCGHLSSVLGMAKQWTYISSNPCPGLFKFSKEPRKSYALKKREASALIKEMQGPASQLLVELDLATGLRWGEITELRGKDVCDLTDEDDDDDVDPEQQDPDAEEMVYLWVRRSVSDIGSTSSGRFQIEPTPKNGTWRKVTLGPIMSGKVRAHIRSHKIGPNDLLFPLSMFTAELQAADRSALDEVIPFPSKLGMTEPNEKGRTYAHGTPSAYGPGKCRCSWCQKAMREYRAQRRADGFDLKPRKGGPSRREANKTGHLPRDTFRAKFWVPALSHAGLTGVRFHDLRHTHATMLARRKVNVLEIKDRMGHTDIKTTMLYIDENRALGTSAAHMMDKIFG